MFTGKHAYRLWKSRSQALKDSRIRGFRNARIGETLRRRVVRGFLNIVAGRFALLKPVSNLPRLTYGFARNVLGELRLNRKPI
jgi:hypothetical protein